MSPYRVTIVGAGLTGCLTACRLKRAFKEDVSITILEKSRGAGGRMSTSRSSSNPKLTCDLGAQYISATPEYQEKHKDFYNELVNAGAIKEFAGKIVGPNRFGENAKHYIAPLGINSVSKHFLKDADLNPSYQKTVEKVDVSLPENACTINLKDGAESFISDAVVLTIPAPQLLQMQGNVQDFLEPYKSKLEGIVYSSRYALALFYNENKSLNLPWDCKYVADDECIRFISIDNEKRGTGSDHGFSVVVHTSVPFGIKHLEESFEKVEPLILSHVKKILPILPEPTSTKCQRWRYSQIHKPFPESPGCLVLNGLPMLIAGGDSFSHSNFDGCVDSSTAIVENLSKQIKARL